MSYQLLHILSPGCSLGKDRGQLVMRHFDGDEPEKRCAIEDIRAVIIAARGISISGDLIRALCQEDAVILHCDEKYRPCGLTAPLSHTTRTEMLARQCAQGSALHRHLWARIVGDKVENQSRLLKFWGIADGIPHKIGEKVPEESAAARFYWRAFFRYLGTPEELRDQESGTPVNNMLNYGYAVLAALVHRAIVTHGLLPEIGFHHAVKYAGFPLVYDLMEPFRPFVDLLVLSFLHFKRKGAEDVLFSDWCRFVTKGLLEIMVSVPRQELKLLYAIDAYVTMIAECLDKNTIRSYWSLKLEKQQFQNGLDPDHV